ncbi:hypothetical protein [Shewanella algae]|uniref:hypothetical protein n=1 Tax=Shewanella algae TaxID=38313 RepID=UPI0031F5C47A
MNVFEMMRSGDFHPIWFVFLAQGIVLATLCFLLAKSKNRNTFIASMFGFIPFLSYVAILYYVGVPKLNESSAQHGS